MTLATAVAFSAAAAEWENVGPETRVGGRMASGGYMKGKVVLLDVRDYSQKSGAKEMAQIQNIWNAYKSKAFVAIGSHASSSSKDEAAELVKKLHLSYPVYSDVRLKNEEGTSETFNYGVHVFDPTGKLIFTGNDPRQASGVVGSAIFAARIPSSPKYWKCMLDYEIENLPGQAYLRIRDLKANHKDALRELAAKYPEDVKRYAKTWSEYVKSSEIKQLAKLVETSRLVKDRDKTSRAAKRLSAAQLESIIKQYSVLTKSENPLVVQEAKNSIAELKFAQAELSK